MIMPLCLYLQLLCPLILSPSLSSKEIWCRLKKRYTDDTVYNIMNLKTSLYNIQKGSDSIDKYLHRVKSICDQLATVGVYMADEDIIASVLHGFPSKFSTMKIIIRNKTLKSPVSMEEFRSLLLIAEDEINQSVKSISLSLEAAMDAFDDNSRGILSSYSLNNSCLPNSEMVGSSTTPAAIISNTNALASNSSKLVTQIGCVPQPTVISSTPGYVSASTHASSVVPASNTMMFTSSVTSPTGCTMQYMSNSEYMMSATPAALNGCIISPSPSPYMFNVQPQNVGYSPYNNGLVQSQVNTGFIQPNGSIQYDEGLIKPHDTFSCQNHCVKIKIMVSMDREIGSILMVGGVIYLCTIIKFQARSSDSPSVCSDKICQICKQFGHLAGTCPQRSAPWQIIASGSYMQCQICMKTGHSAAECLYRHSYTFQPPTYVPDAIQSLPLHIDNATLVSSDLSEWHRELLMEIKAFPTQGTWQLLSTLEKSGLRCWQASYPQKPCQSLPLIDPG